MAVRFDSFSLSEMTAKTEDAFLLGQDGLTLLTYPVHFETVPMTVQGRVLLRPVIAVL